MTFPLVNVRNVSRTHHHQKQNSSANYLCDLRNKFLLLHTPYDMRVETTTTVVRNYTHTPVCGNKFCELFPGLLRHLWVLCQSSLLFLGLILWGKQLSSTFYASLLHSFATVFPFLCVGIMLLLLLLDFFENVVAISPPRMNPFQLTRGLILLFCFCFETTRVASGNERRNFWYYIFYTTFTYI